MTCFRNYNQCFGKCRYFVTTTAVAYDAGTNVLALTIPAGTYTNQQKLCVYIAQAIPTGVNSNTKVQIVISGQTAGSDVIKFTNGSLGNYLYGTQISQFGVYCLRVATDSNLFVLTGGTPIKSSGHAYGVVPIPTA